MHGVAWARYTRRREMLHIAMLVALDALAMTSAFEIARAVRGDSKRPFEHLISTTRFTAVDLAAAPLWIAIFALCGLYRVRVHGGRVSEVSRVIVAVTLGVMVLISVDYYTFRS